MDSPVTLPRRRGPSTTPWRPRPFLFLALEAGRPNAGAGRFALDDSDVIVLGRGAARTAGRTLVGGVRTLELRVADPRMSSRHAVLTRTGNSVTLVDHSRNGTVVNGAAVSDLVLRDGDLIETGETYFIYRAALLAPPDLGDGGPVDAAPGLATLIPAFAERADELVRIADSRVAVVLHGPSGAGKEVLARLVHERSRRAGPFVAVNCGAIPATLVESELFGHKKGAFSGANTDRVGLIAAADGGTLFLDEIGDLPLDLQPALLRALEDRMITPVGSTTPVPVDFRLVSATHRELSGMVARGQFREDLLARLSGYTMMVPPLCERREDLGTLVARVLARVAPERAVSLSPEVAAAMLRHTWPRNVRELEKALEAGLALAGPGAIELDVAHLATIAAPRLRPVTDPPTPGPDDDHEPDDVTQDDPRKDALIEALRAHRGNVSAAARAMGKPRSQIQRWMRRWNLSSDDYA
ncbi:MAG: sigma 54-interacting transcriptional regulator [Deltaproteobacteria bacterium]|nr:sigma 54-interacting transcriptional regulator [Deltaproteobacteria bacterium]